VTAAGTRGRVVRISVEDRGLGIDPADRAHVFEPFYRGQQAAALQIHGSGLGLSLVRKIVDAHGGRVDVVSTPGSGSTFTIELPALGPVTQKANAGGVEPLRAADYAD
jgi:signal transduction histidine kinase